MFGLFNKKTKENLIYYIYLETSMDANKRLDRWLSTDEESINKIYFDFYIASIVSKVFQMYFKDLVDDLKKFEEKFIKELSRQTGNRSYVLRFEYEKYISKISYEIDEALSMRYIGNTKKYHESLDKLSDIFFKDVFRSSYYDEIVMHGTNGTFASDIMELISDVTQKIKSV